MDSECNGEQSVKSSAENNNNDGCIVLFPIMGICKDAENEEGFRTVERPGLGEMTMHLQPGQNLAQEKPQEQIFLNYDNGNHSCSSTPPQVDGGGGGGGGVNGVDDDDEQQNDGLKRKGINFNDRERFFFFSAIIEARGRLGIEYSHSKPYKYVSEPLWAEAKRILASTYEIHKIPPESYPRNIKSLRELVDSSMRNGTTAHQKRSGRPKIIDNFEEQTKRYLENNLSLRQIQAAFLQDHNQTIAVSTLSRIAHKLKMVRPKCYHGTNRPKTLKRKSKGTTTSATT